MSGKGPIKLLYYDDWCHPRHAPELALLEIFDGFILRDFHLSIWDHYSCGGWDFDGLTNRMKKAKDDLPERDVFFTLVIGGIDHTFS